MRRAVILCSLAASSAVLLAAFSKLPERWRRNDAPAFYMTVSVTPSRPAVHRLPLPVPERTYTCSVFVHEAPGSQRVWGTGDLVLAAGQSDEKSNTLGELTLRFRASIAADARSANTAVVITRGEKVLAHQRSIFALGASN